MRNRKEDVKFEIVESIVVLSTQDSGWSKELNRVAWNGNEPKYDIRAWNEDHTQMGRGLTLTDEEMCALLNGIIKDVVFDYDGDDDIDADDEPEEVSEAPEEEDDPEPEEDEELEDGVVKITHTTPFQSTGVMHLNVAKFIENRPLKDIGDFVRKIVKTADNRSEVVPKIIKITRDFVLANAEQRNKAETNNYKKGSRMLELVAPLS